MAWEVEYTNEFERWWLTLDADAQDSIDVVVRVLEERGPGLPFPLSSGVHGSRHGHMRELRIQHRGEPYRVFFAFDPRRTALLLGDDRFYERMIPIADRLYDQHLEELAREVDKDG